MTTTRSRYIIQKETRGTFRPQWVITAIYPDAPCVVRIASYPTRRAAITTARLLAGRTGSVEVAATPTPARYSQAVSGLVKQS